MVNKPLPRLNLKPVFVVIVAVLLLIAWFVWISGVRLISWTNESLAMRTYQNATKTRFNKYHVRSGCVCSST